VPNVDTLACQPPGGLTKLDRRAQAGHSRLNGPTGKLFRYHNQPASSLSGLTVTRYAFWHVYAENPTAVEGVNNQDGSLQRRRW
jgi:hypothetical protein